jgi:hypothetical protein
MTLIGSIDPYALKIPARRAERSFTRFHPEVATRRHSALAAWPRLVRQNGPIGDRLQHQLGRPFEHEARLKDLLAKQAQLNACLDLDKHDTQIVGEPDDKPMPDRPSVVASPNAPQPSA